MGRIAGLMFACFTLAAGLTGCLVVPRSPDKAPTQLASYVDMPRFSGKWYIIANIPYFAERGKVASYFDIQYSGKKLLDIFYGKDAFDKPFGSFTMDDYVVPGTGNAVWRETPLGLIYFSYLIVYVDPDYKTALVGYPGHELAWVMSREPAMDDTTYQGLLARLNAAGYDASQLRKVPQSPEQQGKPGFQ
jgi:apolipoprotein D and lipocalin family protein